LDPQPLSVPRGGFFGLSGYHWLVIAAGWAGWGFDVFDAVLFNFVAPECIPALLHLPRGSHAARQATVFWTGAITSILLVSWALGGVLFGWVADRVGRKRALVAEAVPEGRRVEAGVIMQTGSPLGIVLAGAVNYQIAGVWFAADPQSSWRYVFLAGLLPVLLALAVRLFLRESAHWTASRAGTPPSTPRELFAPGMRAATVSGVFAAVIAVLTWWACNAFIPLLGRTLAAEHAVRAGLLPAAATLLAAGWQAHASNAFNLGGLLGAFAAVPLATRLGRRPMFIAYFLFSAIAIFITFGLQLAPQTRLAMLFVVGAGVYGIFGAFTFYLPELFPARLRATGAGFCYNIGRLIAAGGPFVIGLVSAMAGGSSAALMRVLFWVALVPLAAALVARFVIVETRGRALPA
jgi:MFS family permease